MAPKTRFLKGFLLQFSGLNTHNSVKNDPKLENNTLFDAKILWSLTGKDFQIPGL